MKQIFLILLSVILLCGCHKDKEFEKTFFDNQRGFVHECPECNGIGVVLDWDSIKTGLLSETPTSKRKYIRCPNKCPIPMYYIFRRRQFIVEPQKDKTYKIIELVNDGMFETKKVYDYI